MAIVKRNNKEQQQQQQSSPLMMRFLLLLTVALGALFLVLKNSSRSNSDVDGVATNNQKNGAAKSHGTNYIRHRNVIEEGDATGRTFTFDIANLNDGTSGEVVIQTFPEWAPIGVSHFHDLMDEGFYKDCRFFRVVPNFVTQFGIQGTPGQFPDDPPIKDDPNIYTNAYGTITFATAGPDTRTTQLFVNTNKNGNARLDKQGFAPFAKVISGMEFIDDIFAGYGEEPSQGDIEKFGNAYLEEHFPNLSYISNVKSLEEAKEDGGE